MKLSVKTKPIKLTQQWVLLFFILLVNNSICSGQNLGLNFKIDPGFSITQMKDTRQSSVFRSALGWSFGLQFELQDTCSSNTLGFKFAQLGASNNEDLTSYVWALGASELRIFYEHWRPLKNKNWQVGAYLDHGFFITDRDIPFFYISEDNPSSSYVIWSSLGLAGRYHKALSENWNVQLKAALPLLAFTERPAYSFNFPEEHYDDNDDFLLFQADYFKHAQFRTLTQFTNLQLQAGLQRRIGQKNNSLGVNYQWSYLFAGGAKPLFRFNHHFTIVYQFSFKKL